MEKTHEEWHCRKCGELIDAPTVTGMLCSECWLKDEKAA